MLRQRSPSHHPTAARGSAGSPDRGLVGIGVLFACLYGLITTLYLFSSHSALSGTTGEAGGFVVQGGNPSVQRGNSGGGIVAGGGDGSSFGDEDGGVAVVGRPGDGRSRPGAPRVRHANANVRGPASAGSGGHWLVGNIQSRIQTLRTNLDKVRLQPKYGDGGVDADGGGAAPPSGLANSNANATDTAAGEDGVGSGEEAVVVEEDPDEEEAGGDNVEVVLTDQLGEVARREGVPVQILGGNGPRDDDDNVVEQEEPVGVGVDGGMADKTGTNGTAKVLGAAPEVLPANEFGLKEEGGSHVETETTEKLGEQKVRAKIDGGGAAVTRRGGALLRVGGK